MVESLTSRLEDGRGHNPHVLTVHQIGMWWGGQQPGDHCPKPPIIAQIPRLQRGIVWSPHQLELLWDSLLRGFPVGSFVVCQPIGDQTREGDPTTGDERRHLLNGRQRVHAIAAGFVDAWTPLESSAPSPDRPSDVVWLDLDPEGRLKTTTRAFLVRVTNAAHPWGFKVDDQATTPLGSRQIGEARKQFECTDCRPVVREAWPYESGLCLPLSWLLRSTSCNPDAPSRFWQDVLGRCQQADQDAHAEASPFRRALEFIPDMPEARRQGYHEALKRALNHQIVALEVPSGVLDGLPDDDMRGRVDAQGEEVSPLEQLFTRLNVGGTVPSREDLTYSIIKARWPCFEEALKGFADSPGGHQEVTEARVPKPVPDVRLANLAARAVLTACVKGSDELVMPKGLQRALSIEALRALAHPSDAVKARHDALDAFFRSSSPARLVDCCRLVDTWLLYRGNNDFGLPPFLRSEIAWNSPEVYLLLLVLALGSLSKTGSQASAENAAEAIRKPLVALTTVIHWFGLDKGRCCDRVLTELWPRLHDPDRYRGIILRLPVGTKGKALAAELRDPQALAALEGWKLPDPGEGAEKDLENWTWWSAIIGGDAAKQVQLWPFLDRMRNQRGILAFAQRDYLARCFREFDPANLAFWRGYNRPWDYDHILASASVHDLRTRHRFVGVVREWINTIGNQRICPFEENRSDQDLPANKKITTAEARRDALMETEPEVDAFSARRETAEVAARAYAFCIASQARLVRIYEEWWRSLAVDVLLGGPQEPAPSNEGSDRSQESQGATQTATRDRI